jgi:SRSO17 transposase
VDVPQLRRLKPKLTSFLKRFDDCFPRKDTRAHLPTYITGQLSDLPDKSVEPMAIKAGGAPRTLQEFLSQHRWDDDRVRDRLQEIVRTEHAGPRSIGILDETSFVKKGNKTPGVKRQWCGTLGKKDNCTVTVHLGYARDDFHCLLDGELFLPEDWSQDRDRCREAGIPDTMTYRPKWRIGLELFDRARGNGLHFDWMTFDEGYGSKPDFLRGLSTRQQQFVGEVPRNFVGWLKPPRIITRPFHKHGRGWGRKVPRLASGSPPAQRVDELLERRELRVRPWQRWRIKDGDKGPMVWEIKHTRLVPKDEDGLPGEPLHLIIARNVLDPKEVKFFVSNAPPEAPVATLLLVAFSRWRVERCFEDQKGEVGLDHYEGRRYQGLKRHLILSAVSYLFLSRMRQEFGGEKSGVDGVPGAHRHRGVDPLLVAGGATFEEAAGANGGGASEDAASQCDGTQEPHQTDKEAAPRAGYQTYRAAPVCVGEDLAL